MNRVVCRPSTDGANYSECWYGNGSPMQIIVCSVRLTGCFLKCPLKFTATHSMQTTTVAARIRGCMVTWCLQLSMLYNQTSSACSFPMGGNISKGKCIRNTRDRHLFDSVRTTDQERKEQSPLLINQIIKMAQVLLTTSHTPTIQNHVYQKFFAYPNSFRFEKFH
jgi:hypothetical protein